MRNLVARLYGKEEGFTLIELLVVVAIIALLATFAVPKLFDAINKSKKAPGQADMQTISGALERYYLDSQTNAYPVSTATVTVDDALRNGYLKGGTTFLNGFKQPYLYGTSAGSAYFLIDLQGTAYTPGTATTVTVTCGAAANTVTFNIPATATGLVSVENINAAWMSNCAAPAGAAMVKN